MNIHDIDILLPKIENLLLPLKQNSVFLELYCEIIKKTKTIFLDHCIEKSRNNILSNVQAYHNCIESNNTDWETKHYDRVIETLENALPHGSGINCKWEFDIKHNYIWCSNSYHRMNSDGYYCEYIDFTVKLFTLHRDIHGKIEFSISGQFGKHQDLKDYLYETIGYSLETL